MSFDPRAAAKRLLSAQPSTAADIDALTTWLAGRKVAALDKGQSIDLDLGHEVVVVLEGSLHFPATGLRAELRAPAVAGAATAFGAAVGPTRVRATADESSTLLRLPAAELGAELVTGAPGSERLRWILLGALTHELARLSDHLRGVASGQIPAGDAMAAAEVILAGATAAS